MNEAVKKHLKRTAILCLIALCIGAGLGWIEVRKAHAHGAHSDAVAGAEIGGPFTLTDQNGKPVTEKILAGKYALIYFGFTSCPDTCPTELAKITKALKALGADADKIQPVFITVDPARDTPATMKSYLASFDPRFIGLTGTQAQIDAVTKEYKIYASKHEPESASDYTVDHSSFDYFIAPDGDLLTLFRSDDTAETMAQGIEKALKSPE